MTEPSWTEGLTELLARTRAGDADAQSQVFARAYERLRQLCRVMLPGFRDVARGADPTDLANELYISLVAAFADGHIPADETEFLRFAARKLRWLLLDLKDKADVRKVMSSLEGMAGVDSAAGHDPSESTLNPVKLAEWTEFHRQVEHLPDDEREIVDLHLYAGLTQAEVSTRLGLHPKAVSRLWLSASGKLGPYMPAGS